MKRITQKSLKRIENKFFVEPNSGCWLWTASTDRNGYGLVVSAYAPKKIYAHRYSWELLNGEIPQGKFILHKCDTPCCINPSHLFVGTQRDNMDDKVKKGRQSSTPGQRGEACKTAKLSWAIVTDIRKSSESARSMARRFNVSHGTILNIKHGKTWVAA